MERNDSKCPFASLFPITSAQQALLVVTSLHFCPDQNSPVQKVAGPSLLSLQALGLRY